MEPVVLGSRRQKLFSPSDRDPTASDGPCLQHFMFKPLRFQKMEPMVLTSKISSPPHTERGERGAGLGGGQRRCAVALQAACLTGVHTCRPARCWLRPYPHTTVDPPDLGEAAIPASLLPACGRSGKVACAAGLASPLLAHSRSGGAAACLRPALRPGSSPTAGQRRLSLPARGQTGAVDSRPRRWHCQLSAAAPKERDARNLPVSIVQALFISSPHPLSLSQLLALILPLFAVAWFASPQPPLLPRWLCPKASLSLLGVLVLVLLGAFTPHFLFWLRCRCLLQVCFVSPFPHFPSPFLPTVV
jgi:hypothetical protein